MGRLVFSQGKNYTDCSAALPPTVAYNTLPSIYFFFFFVTSTTGALSPYPVHNSFDWAGPVHLADFQVLTNQVVSAKCVYQCLNIPVLTALSVVFNSPLYNLIFPEAGAL